MRPRLRLPSLLFVRSALRPASHRFALESHGGSKSLALAVSVLLAVIVCTPPTANNAVTSADLTRPVRLWREIQSA